MSRSIFRDAEQLAAAQMIAERRQPTRLHYHQQDEARAVLRRLPQRRVAFECRKRRFEILVRHHAKHMVGGIVARFHPGIDIGATRDLPFMDVWRVSQGFKSLGEPLRPCVITAGVADKDIRHAHLPRAGLWQ